MKTTDYNPSTLEVEMAQVIAEMQTQIQLKMQKVEITHVEKNFKLDNPRLRFTIKDADGDIHKVVVQVVQTIDEF
jgi:hypothetical protein